MNAQPSAGGGMRAGAYARLWHSAGACRHRRVGGRRFVGVICHECAGVRACRFLSAKSHELFYGQMHREERENFIRSVAGPLSITADRQPRRGLFRQRSKGAHAGSRQNRACAGAVHNSVDAALSLQRLRQFLASLCVCVLCVCVCVCARAFPLLLSQGFAGTRFEEQCLKFFIYIC